MLASLHSHTSHTSHTLTIATLSHCTILLGNSRNIYNIFHYASLHSAEDTVNELIIYAVKLLYVGERGGGGQRWRVQQW